MCSYSIVENSKPTEGSGRHLLSASLRPENTYSAYIISCNPHKNFIPNIIELNLLELELGFRLPNPCCSGDLVPTSYYKSQVGGEASTSFFPPVMDTKTDRSFILSSQSGFQE